VLRAIPLCTCYRHYPGAAPRGLALLYSPGGISLPWFAYQVGLRISYFRRLLSVHSRCSLHTRASHLFMRRSIQRLRPLRLLHSRSGCFRLEHRAGRVLHPLGKPPPFHGARRSPLVTVACSHGLGRWSIAEDVLHAEQVAR